MPIIGTFNYSGDPKASRLDWVRFEIQDIDPEAPLLSDGEIMFLVSEEAASEPPSQAELLSAAARGCEVLSRRFAAQANTTVGTLKASYDKSAENYAERAKELRLRATGSKKLFFGGRSESEKEAQLLNPDKVQPFFARNQFLNPWKGQPGGPLIVPGEGHPL